MTLHQRAVGSMHLRLGVEFAKPAFRLSNKAEGLLSLLSRYSWTYRQEVSLTAHPLSNDTLHAHPSILGPGFREPNPLTWCRPSRASIPFEERDLPHEQSASEAPRL